MLSVGQKFPHFSLTGVASNDLAHAFQPFDQASHPGKWKVVFFWPKDFTFVCPTEIAARQAEPRVRRPRRGALRRQHRLGVRAPGVA